jgi:hypothetical protein
MADNVRSELRSLREEVSRLNNHRFIRLHDSFPRLLAFNFARGLAFGVGTVVGASVLISALLWALSTIEFLPIIGDWAAQIAREIEAEITQ